MVKRLLSNRTFYVGMVAGVVLWQVVLPRFAPGIKAKLPLS